MRPSFRKEFAGCGMMTYCSSSKYADLPYRSSANASVARPAHDSDVLRKAVGPFDDLSFVASKRLLRYCGTI